MNQEKSISYDLPLRIFHFLFAVLFITSFSIAKFVDDESILYTFHMISGILMTFIIILRVFWGFFGSKFSKFSSFQLKPSLLVKYLKSIVIGESKRYLGHNPASSYAAIAMFLLTIALFLSGLFMVKGVNKHFFEEVHELSANTFIVLVIVHIAGVLFHQFRHDDGLITSMFNGQKNAVFGEVGISSTKRFVAFLFIALFVMFSLYLKMNFNFEKQSLNLFGTHLQLGEIENAQDHDDDD
ncbi:MAG: cytochrome b [Bdellovibrio sp. CG12_big_fil_rev_8_21_14_0_65_39_13]|nr:MAG: cytochrome b [Bdellovibrio sp. CG22_combo_CG10-13_8_21_14_all_39_27]PIQ60331.1 MAG: cytochrome b [Bdellovibrio sp. CG12_big_fil_rev_8_21_14_0_65_39_13]PIR35059.1 MAG: cytochrome b [Bdellovibrio sp. CG11_big_fil_rev_8_21_14_0_20_39_38]